MASISKRKQNDEISGRDKKKQKMNIARTIPVQSSSSGNGIVKGMQGLPSAIDVEKFAEARAFEINAMEKAMKTASGASTQRAWQALPRHLRRRAASHDVRRVPVRLREKAKAEMDPMRKTLLSRKLPKQGKNKRITRTESFAKRQRDKSWLETHVWHAKRMKMETMWGYRLAVQPTEKSYRPSHRASVQGSIVHDASYYATIELEGMQSTLVSILELVCDPQDINPGSFRWRGGSKVYNTHLYSCTAYPFNLIGPVTIIWKPSVTQTFADSTAQRDMQATTIQATDQQSLRIVWLRVHPMIYDDVTRELQKATSQVLDRPRTSSEEIAIEIADLRGQINAFEIMGPMSNQVLSGALSPILKDGRKEFKQFWSALPNLRSPGSVPHNMVIGFTVIDPRLNFPPNNPKVDSQSEEATTYPSSTLARSDIWEQDVRKSLSVPRYKKKDIDERRSKNLVPGTKLAPQRQDDRVPVLLLRKSLVGHDNAEGIHGWTLIVPAGWSMAFFSSLVYTGTRVAGQRERQTQAYEAGVLYFPRDLPFSSGYEAWAKKREEEAKNTWLRKPPAKRTNYQKLGTRSPWCADWDIVLGLREPIFVEIEDDTDICVTTQRDLDMAMDVDGAEEELADVDMDLDVSDLKPWLFRGLEAAEIIQKIEKRFNPAPDFLDEINKLRTKRFMEPLSSMIKADQLLKHALVNVRVVMYQKGVPDDLSMIYSLSDEEATSWEHLLEESTKGLHGNMVQNALQLANKIPPHEQIIGYVTTGHYSLSQGKGSALGAIPLTRFLELKVQQERLHSHLSKHTLMVKVRSTNAQQCRPAYLELASTEK